MWSTAASWMALIALTAALTKYYNPDLFNKFTGNLLVRSDPPAETQKPNAQQKKAKRTHASRVEPGNSGASTPTSATEGQANKRRKLVSAPVGNTVIAETVDAQQVNLPRDEDGGMSNKEFAQQLAKAQAGTKLEPSKSQPTSKKERRAAKKAVQANQNGQEASGLSTENSSSTGRDADDDLSPVGSPATGPVSTAPTSRAGDVSDMLEAPTAKPTTLRLTDVKDASRTTSKSSSTAFEPVLSKKQRQRQAKQAEQRALREESDRVHEAKKQAQLRTARLAEGTSNQTKANSFTAKQNAWQGGKPPPEKSLRNGSNPEAAQLLDTFGKEETPRIKVNGMVNSEPQSENPNPVPDSSNVNAVRQEVREHTMNALAASSREKFGRSVLETRPSWADEVNEEEQDKWATELANEEKWEAVTRKKEKKKAKKDNDTSSEASSSLARPTTTNKPVTNGSRENAMRPRMENLNRFQSIEPAIDPTFQDAEWEA
ncbi:uncharacterized protein Z518_05538 [Rhinocladiella mackenziei CBS 650.93]|uniref:Uncharacterized protein n=1 Tax=Rhinocladiella mackenziei CBS 650.93 TaxID=1442369 RepID=A0A0D2H2K6_9EURO|nr:uncharacterized protein Z518_05538 [Rhinocladiella mackenziei CBS 650.93]KIX04668.1 hypothetical protein Z518_05538 [Rhinocladiella mackenziei CBS 650.93]